MSGALNIRFLLLLVFSTICVAATILCIVLLPSLILEEKLCHEVSNDAQILLKRSGDSSIWISLDTARTVKRRLKYFQCNKVNNSSKNFEHAQCTHYEWKAPSVVNQVTDCFSYDPHVYWYGGSSLWTQHWPLNSVVMQNQPYIPGDIYKQQYGGVMERFWISSLGIAIIVDSEIPLWLEMKPGQLCFTGNRSRHSYYNVKSNSPILSYFVCNGTDMRSLYQNLSLWKTPSTTPERNLFQSPIWSTWAYFKQNISSSSILEFAKNITHYKLPASQIEIDDKWTPNYGDNIFDNIKFPDPKAFIDEIHDMGFNVTIWVHPFVNRDSSTYVNALDKMKIGNTHLVVESELGNSSKPAFTNWWRGINSTLIDVTAINGSGRAIFLSSLEKLRADFGVDSFKFDAGETNWLPEVFSLKAKAVNPGIYTLEWSTLAYEADTNKRRQETRVGYKSQHLPVLVRAMDKDSHWEIDNGLKALVTSSLTHCLTGYNFYLPDMVGGNAYCNETGLEGKCLPDKELYIRWLQVSSFMPSLQFSIPPWIYDSDTLEITRKFLQFRNSVFFNNIIDYGLDQFLRSNIPIISPLWWIDPTDKNTFNISDQFILSQQLLIAPILKKGQHHRNIYFPKGSWSSIFKNESFSGPLLVKDYEVPLDAIPVFINSKFRPVPIYSDAASVEDLLSSD